ncbi:hypothetical protein BHK98_09595 [Hornefia porci]|uniref:Uncharacterized protein n=1 Tax=Hornefia porci TaxID=2652292 RepID=A0A1Q9JJA2_9FIRM|nr:hypothetical protein [Hornefia porci]OLR56298.1 hypothetical protein BHK98_09595 [Hornefia porci]
MARRPRGQTRIALAPKPGFLMTAVLPADRPTAGVPSQSAATVLPADRPTAGVPSQSAATVLPADKPTAGVPSQSAADE